MKKYYEITEARKVLGLPERASMDEIKASYRNLIREWHPDISKEAKEKCTEVTTQIVAAYETIIAYCHHYKFSFSEEEVRYHVSEVEWWHERFGNDPFWAN